MYPCIDIALTDKLSELDEALLNLKHYDWLIFTSSNTVHALVSHIKNRGLTVDWSDVKIACVGTKTVATVHEETACDVDFIPRTHTGLRLASDIPIKPDETLLLPQSELADDSLFKALMLRGVQVKLIEAYRNIIGQDGDDIPTLIEENRIDAITFTSGSTITNFMKRISPLTAFEIPAVCIGSSSYKVARDAGFRQVYYPEKFTIPDMIELLSGLFDKEN
ncbi:MAG: hypothetical protein Phog2KO_29010 [Phototrophicaceae bacterium]